MNERQGRFVLEYLVDLNATQAAERAGYSKKTAHSIGHRLLSNVEIAAAIAKAQGERAHRTQVTVDRVLEELAVLSFSNIWDYQIDDSGHVVLAADAAPEAIRAVSSIKRRRRVIPRKDDEDIVEIETEIRLWDKPATLRLTGQHLGMYVEKREHKLTGGGVLAVPMPVDAEQWAATAAAQQALSMSRPATAQPPAGS